MMTNDDARAELDYDHRRGICQACWNGDCGDCDSTPEDFTPCKCECVGERAEATREAASEQKDDPLGQHTLARSTLLGGFCMYVVYWHGELLFEVPASSVDTILSEIVCWIDRPSKTIMLL